MAEFRYTPASKNKERGEIQSGVAKIADHLSDKGYEVESIYTSLNGTYPLETYFIKFKKGDYRKTARIDYLGEDRHIQESGTGSVTFHKEKIPENERVRLDFEGKEMFESLESFVMMYSAKLGPPENV